MKRSYSSGSSGPRNSAARTSTYTPTGARRSIGTDRHPRRERRLRHRTRPQYARRHTTGKHRCLGAGHPRRPARAGRSGGQVSISRVIREDTCKRAAVAGRVRMIRLPRGVGCRAVVGRGGGRGPLPYRISKKKELCEKPRTRACGPWRSCLRRGPTGPRHGVRPTPTGGVRFWLAGAFRSMVLRAARMHLAVLV